VAPLLPVEVAEAARLTISELVTNALLHAPADAGPIELTLRLEPGMLTVEVRNSGEPFVPDVQDRSEATGGRGLRIVEGLADRWGVRADHGTCVWAVFTLPTPAGAVP
jgi:anti-sigma regulatory factor (Ser/Thr protein kinase)